jgi:hypothetical protein
MIRIPLLAVVSRETDRLPAATINAAIGCTGPGLPFDQTKDLTRATRGQPSTRYFLYYISSMEVLHGSAMFNESLAFKDRFVLVEVNGCYEKILDQGVARGFRVYKAENSYADIAVVGEKLGNFKFYVPDYFELHMLEQ